ncbi:MAG: O-antigen ligase family protein [Thermoguttaceae bacterium]
MNTFDATPTDFSHVSPNASAAACSEAGWSLVARILCFLVVSRLVFEAVNTFGWDSASYAWSACALVAILFILWPLVMTLARGEGNLLVTYFPVLAFLLIMLVRTQFGDTYSLKCLLSEVIVGSCLLFTVETCERCDRAATLLRKWLMWVIQANILLGVGQLIWAGVRGAGFSPAALLQARAVQGVFIHPNLFIVVVLPFLFYFLKQRSWIWCLLTLIACLGTGTRSPFFAAACLIIPIWQSARRRPITWLHLGVTLLLVLIGYTLLIRANQSSWEYDPDLRTNLSTLQWRIAHWNNFLEDRGMRAIWFGHGVGTADNLGGVFGEEPQAPHNDYVRTYYDLGLVGLLATAMLIGFMIRRLMRSTTTDNDFVLLAYLLIVCFRVTDNFMYITVPLWIYMFVGCYLGKPTSQSTGPALEEST